MGKQTHLLKYVLIFSLNPPSDGLTQKFELFSLDT